MLAAIFPTSPNGWYMGLINNVPTPILSPSDTLTSHSGWAEVAGNGVGYTGNRPLWTNGSASAQVITNAGYVSFAITATTTVYGIFLCNVSTGTSGKLFGTGPFVGGSQAVVNTDTLQISLSVSATSS